MQLLFILFVIVAAIAGAHISWSLTDSLIRRLPIEPRDWIIQQWRTRTSE